MAKIYLTMLFEKVFPVTYKNGSDAPWCNGSTWDKINFVISKKFRIFAKILLNMKYNWSKENLEKTVKEANCWFNWLEILGIPKRGCNYRTLKAKAQLYSIDVSHFNYLYAKTHNGKNSLNNMTDDEIFSTDHNNRILKREYIKRILNNKPHCEICGIEDWCGKQISFQLHHIDGNHKNSSINNLQLLCPNCHSQTENYSNKKR